jgi:V/A-type H+/Na+-transporting ATPase subunit D
MSKIKLTKNSLRLEQHKLMQFERYLPTLQLKKSMLQVEVSSVSLEIEKLYEELNIIREKVEKFAFLLVKTHEIDIIRFIKVNHISKTYENIAGVEIPVFQSVVFEDVNYSLYDTPFWTGSTIKQLKDLVIMRERINVLQEKKKAIEKDLKDVSIRVNLFEKILIPRSERNIRKIKTFLGDQELAAVSQAKVAKQKLEKE